MANLIGIHLYSFSLNRPDDKDNFGDLIGKYLIDKLTKRNIIEVKHPSMRRYKIFIKHYLTVGSILEVANKNSIIWGSGIIRQNDYIEKAKFLLVRGPYTRNRLLQLKYDVPERYGDPALILSDFYPKKNNPKYKIGIAPHYIDYNLVINSVANTDLNVIDLLTVNVETVIDSLVDCSIIFSSSLHGIIVAHSYGIPAIWIQLSNNLGGDNIKFYDYFESVGIFNYPTIRVSNKNLKFDYLLKIFQNNRDISLPIQDMITLRKSDIYETCPF